jgi:UDP-N-acetyl-D-mannosaminuronic acid transferase (WecB/TagA/CpsF family)
MNQERKVFEDGDLDELSMKKLCLRFCEKLEKSQHSPASFMMNLKSVEKVYEDYKSSNLI